MLQLKEGCQITSQTLKAVFVSNVTYIKQYSWFSGLTGTLGSLQERDYLLDMYSADFQIIPTAVPKKFVHSPAKICPTREAQMSATLDEAKATIASGRSIIIFCESINGVNQVNSILFLKIIEIS
jgi:preprotein translocase subunit SecA